MSEIKDKVIAVAGVSQREEKFGFRIFRDLLNSGFKVEAVNPRGGEVLGRRIYKSLKDLEDVPDLVITVVPAQVTERLVQECIDIGVKEIWMQPGSESAAAIESAKSHGITVTYNACFMMRNKIW